MVQGGPLTPVTLIAGAGFLQNLGLIVAPALTSAVNGFNSLAITQQFSSIITAATGILSSSVLDSLRTLGASTFPALTNSIPAAQATTLAPIAPSGVAAGGFTGLISNTAQGIMGNGDLSRFSQVFSSANGYAAMANQFINSDINISNISTTFGPITGGMDNLTTGSFSQVSEAFGALGADMTALGNLIDLSNLPNLGDPSALVRQLISIGGMTPSVEDALRQAGLDSLDLTRLAAGDFPGLTDTANRRLYEAMTRITGSDLTQIKRILGVTTANIDTMADLLNPVKIFPTSFTTLTMPTPDGLRAIYVDPSGTVNSDLEKYLLDPTAPVYVGDDAVIRARRGLTPLGSSETTLT